MSDTRPGPRRTLSEQAILDAALALLAELGGEWVTIRGIAARVGVAPNAVYTYVPGKVAVLHGVAEELLGRVHDNQAGESPLPWRDRVHSLARDLRTELLAHPGSARLLNVHVLGSVALETTDQDTVTDQFQWGLDRLLDGVAAYAATQRDHRHPGQPSTVE